MAKQGFETSLRALLLATGVIVTTFNNFMEKHHSSHHSWRADHACTWPPAFQRANFTRLVVFFLFWMDRCFQFNPLSIFISISTQLFSYNVYWKHFCDVLSEIFFCMCDEVQIEFVKNPIDLLLDSGIVMHILRHIRGEQRAGVDAWMFVECRKNAMRDHTSEQVENVSQAADLLSAAIKIEYILFSEDCTNVTAAQPLMSYIKVPKHTKQTFTAVRVAGYNRKVEECKTWKQ